MVFSTHKYDVSDMTLVPQIYGNIMSFIQMMSSSFSYNAVTVAYIYIIYRSQLTKASYIYCVLYK